MPAPPENTRSFGRHDEPVSSPPDLPTGKNYLFTVAIDRYRHLTPLSNAVRDARTITELLAADFGFEAQNIQTLYDEEATEANVLFQFRELVRTLTPADSLVIYFGGHGYYDDVFKQGYWLPVGAKERSQENYLPNTTINAILGTLEARHIFLICDACYAGSLFTSYRNAAPEARLEALRSRWGLTAGRNEIVSDGAAGTHSPFAASLLEQLRSVKDQIGVAELCQRVLEEVGSNTEQLPRGEPLQNVRHAGGQFYFRRPVTTTPPEMKGAQTGSLLHNLPDRMALRRASRCEVRIATEVAQLLADPTFATDPEAIRAVPVADAMSVRLVDPLGDAFRIRPVSRAEQFVRADTYTQWVFYVEALRLGRHPLTLAVAILELVNGRELARELVLEETVEVIAELPVRTAADAYRVSGLRFTVNSTVIAPAQYVEPTPDTTRSPQRPRPTLGPRPTPRRSLRPLLSSAAAILLVGAVLWLLVPSTSAPNMDAVPKSDPPIEDVIVPLDPAIDSAYAPTPPATETERWEAAKAADTRAAYGAFLRDFPNSPHAAEARKRLAALPE